jgi:hypothetical protein
MYHKILRLRKKKIKNQAKRNLKISRKKMILKVKKWTNQDNLLLFYSHKYQWKRIYIKDYI